MTCTTGLAIAAVYIRLDCDSSSDGQFHIPGANSLRDVAAYSNHRASELMPGHDRIAYQRRVAINNMQVSATYTTGIHSYHKLIWFRSRVGNIPDSNLTRCIDDSGAHIYTPLASMLSFLTPGLRLRRHDNRLDIGRITPGCL